MIKLPIYDPTNFCLTTYSSINLEVAVLTRWNLENLNGNFDKWFPSSFKWLLAEIPFVNISSDQLHIDDRSILGAGNGFMPSGNKSLPESILIQIDFTIWRNLVTMC